MTIESMNEELASRAEEALDEHGNKDAFSYQPHYRFKSGEPYLVGIRTELLQEDMSVDAACTLPPS